LDDYEEYILETIWEVNWDVYTTDATTYPIS
jgi:hypothetical protein